MKKKLCLLLVFLMVLSPFISGCSGDNTASTDGSSGSSSKNKIIYALSGEPETLDPGMNNYSQSSIVIQNLFKGLYKCGEDGTTIPALAESHTVDDAGLVYTFTLRDNLKWSDGSPLTAHDFEYSWKRVLNPDNAAPGVADLYYLKNAKACSDGKATVDDVGVKAVDDKTLVVTLENPTAYFTDLLCATTYAPVKKDIVEAETPWTKSATTYICSGPFMLKEIKPQEKYVMVKNPNYYNSAEVKLDELDIVFLSSPESELAAYTNNEIDVSDNMSAESLNQYKGTPEFFAAERIGTYYFDINCENKPFDDVRVRRALSLSLNRELIINNIIQTPYKPAYGFVPYGIPYATDPTKNFRDVVGNLFVESLDEAKKLMADAGYPNGEGFPTVNFIILNSQTDRDVAQAMQSMWKENLGINAEITTFESKVYWDELEQGNFDVARDGWTGDYPDPMTNLELFHSRKSYDDMRWLNDEYDSLLNENMAITDQQKRMDNFAKAEQLLMDQMPCIPLYYYNDTYLVKPGVKGVIKNFIGHTLFEYSEVNR